MVGIYKITNPKGKVYIGQSINLQQRLNEYKRLSNCKNQIQLYNSLKKYGWENHNTEILEECPTDLLNNRERYWQEFYNVLGQLGLNCKLTTTLDKTGRNSEESNRQRALTMKGKNRGPRPDVSERNKRVHTGKMITEEHRRQNREKQLGVSKPYGGQNEGRKREVVQWSKDRTIQIGTWDSIISAAKSVKRGPGDIHRVVSGKGNSCAGYYWTYKQ